MTSPSTTLENPSLISSPTKTARWARAIARVLLGFVFFASGLTGLLMVAGVMPQPAPGSIPPAAEALSAAMMNSHYLFAFIKLTEVAVGALLLSNRFVPLALVVLAPVMLNVIAFHAFLAPSGLPIPVVLLALHLFLAWSYRALYQPMLVARA